VVSHWVLIPGKHGWAQQEAVLVRQERGVRAEAKLATHHPTVSPPMKSIKEIIMERTRVVGVVWCPRLGRGSDLSWGKTADPSGRRAHSRPQPASHHAWRMQADKS
jgi:hypothetical protein